MKLRGKVLTSLIIVFVALFAVTSVINVKAANKKKTTKPVEVITDCKESEADLIKKYDPELIYYESSKTWKIKINGNALAKDKTYPRFEITKINGKTTGDYIGNTVYHGTQGELSGLKLNFEKEKTGKSIKIEMKTTQDAKCTKSVTIRLSAEGGYEPKKGKGSTTAIQGSKRKPDTSTSVTCDDSKDYSAQKTFEQRFCYAKKRGKEQHNFTSKVVGTGEEAKINTTSTLKCSPTVVTKEDVKKGTNAKDFTSYDLEDGYTNISWYYATHTTKNAETTEYRYHYYPNGSGKWTTSNGGYKKEVVGCDIKCEEAVKVLYYPPQDSIGGFCFEYKVKIESYVSCGIANAKELEKKRPDINDYDWCTPAPICYHSGANGVTSYRQGGPNEDYEECINACDGGKYTQECSTKCYNEVYKGSIANKTSATDNIVPTQMGKKSSKTTTKARKKSTTSSYKQAADKKLKNGAKEPFYYFSGGSIHFNQTYNGSVPNGGYKYGIGFWYKDGGWGCCGPYTWVKDGIPRGSGCTDSCHWYGCSKGEYLNEKDGNSSVKNLDSDFKKNTEEYEKLLDRCESHATCTKKTATFQMKVDYTEKETGTKVTVNFPYDVHNTSKIDKLESNGGNTSCSESEAQVLSRTACEKVNKKIKSKLSDKTIDNEFNRQKLAKCNNNSILIDYFGCYVGCASRSDYMAEMTFPGSWLLDKTNEVSYDYNHNSKDDLFIDKRFCLPINVKDVNSKWWLWRKQKRAIDSGSTVTSSVSKEYNDKCTTNMTDTTNGSVTTNTSSYDWNIHTFIKEFGMYGWDINVDCFYATNSDPTGNNHNHAKDNNGKCTNAECCTDGANYQARSVDLTNLFPDEEGTPGSSRDAGFNWTSDATTTSGMFGSMGMNPEQLANKIQQRGEKIYNGKDQLDYEFELTPQTLAQIKSKSNKYTDWQGDYTFYDKNGNSIENTKQNANKIVYSVYESKFLKGLSSARKEYVKANALKCNNVKGRNACESFFG